LCEKYQLKEISEYKILNLTTVCATDIEDVMIASENVGISLDEYFDIIVAILNIGNLTFNEDGTIQNNKEGTNSNLNTLDIQIITDLLKADLEEFINTIQKNSQHESKVSSSNYCKVLYFHTFNILSKEINQKLSSKDKISNFISIVDLPGFQEFEKNSFDQFCVNFSNDELNNVNNNLFFKKEQEIYVKERIDWSHIDFELHEELIQKQNQYMDNIDSNVKEEIKEIEHFNGKVQYESEDWNFLNLLKCETNLKSESKRINEIFTSMQKEILINKELKSNLKEISSIIESTKLQRILCILPNELQKPSIFEPKLVLKQIESNYVYWYLRMTGKGFIDHFDRNEFVKRYFMLINRNKELKQKDSEDYVGFQCRMILNDFHSKQYNIGSSLVFLKYSQVFLLEEKRAERIFEIIIDLQSVARMTLVMKEYEKLKTSTNQIVELKQEQSNEIVEQLNQEIEKIKREYQLEIQKTKELTEKINSIGEQSATMEESNQKEIESLHSQIKELYQMISEKEFTIKTLQESTNEIKLQNDLKSSETLLESKNNEINQQEKYIQSLKEHISNLNANLHSPQEKSPKNDKNQDFTKKENQLKKELEEKSNTIDSLKSSKIELERQLNQLKFEQDQAKSLEILKKDTKEKLISLERENQSLWEKIEKEEKEKKQKSNRNMILIVSVIVVSVFSFYAGRFSISYSK
jgi:myosin heavy chain 9/10/11/14